MKIIFFLILISIVYCEPILFSGNNHPRPDIGLNPGFFQNDGLNRPFLNLIHSFSPFSLWFSYDTSYSNFYQVADRNDDDKQLFSDFKAKSINGYPTELPIGKSNRPYLARSFFGVNKMKIEKNNYVLFYEGNGKIDVFGEGIESKSYELDKKKILFKINNTESQLEIRIENISTSSYISNVAIFEKSEISRFNSESTIFQEIELNANLRYSPNFKKIVDNFNLIRFSKWIYFESELNKEWKDRKQKNTMSQLYYDDTLYHFPEYKNTLAYEHMIDICNSFNKNLYIVIPKYASNDYVKNLFELIKNNLKDKLEIWIEYGGADNYGLQSSIAEKVIDFLPILDSVFSTGTKKVFYVIASAYPNQLFGYIGDKISEIEKYSQKGNFEIVFGNDCNFGRDTKFDERNTNLTIVSQLSDDFVLNSVKQSIYFEEKYILNWVNFIASKKIYKTICISGGLFIRAPDYNYRYQMSVKKYNGEVISDDLKELAKKEQELEDFLIDWQKRNETVKELTLDFLMRIHRIGISKFFSREMVKDIDRCENGGGSCGYYGIAYNENNFEESFKFLGLKSFSLGENTKFPFTSKDVVSDKKQCQTNCIYGVCDTTKGQCLCFDGYTGENCSIKKSKKYMDCAPKKKKFGINLSGIPDYSTSFMTTNLQERARKWVSQRFTGYTWDYGDLDTYTFTENGYPAFLEANKKLGTLLIRDVEGHQPSGEMILTYDGDGFIGLDFDAKVTHRSAGRIEFTLQLQTVLNNGIYLQILRTNPSDPIKNIKVFEKRFEAVFEFIPFNPLFLDNIKKYKVLRFMTLSKINFDDYEINWENRTTPEFYSQNLKTGLSIERIVQLCNFLGSDLWFNIHHRASDQYVEKLAQYLKEKLRNDIEIYFEVGNECWGGGLIFTCGDYAEKKGIEGHFYHDDNVYQKTTEARICYHSYLSSKMFRIIKDYFGDQELQRLHFVFNSQAAWNEPTRLFLQCKGETWRNFTDIAIAPYANLQVTRGDTKLDEDMKDIDEFFNDEINVGTNILKTVEMIEKQVKLLNSSEEFKNLNLITYEATPSFSFGSSDKQLDFVKKILKDDRMETVFYNYVSNVTSTPVELFMQFEQTGRPSKYGAWGLNDADDVHPNYSPKQRAYLKIIDNSKTCDWDLNSPDSFQTTSSKTCTSNLNGKSVKLPNNEEVCVCYHGFKGENCESRNYLDWLDCSYQCSFHGVCQSYKIVESNVYHKCSCEKGWAGHHCYFPVCDTDCTYHGDCVGANKCKCYEGFSGNSCEIKCCGGKGNGKCTSDNNCVCNEGFVLNPKTNTCERIKRSADCGFGDYDEIKDQCICWNGYTNLDSGTLKPCNKLTWSPNDGSPIGINVDGVPDYGTAFQFKNIFMTSRELFSQFLQGLNDHSGWYTWSNSESIETDSYGFPKKLKYDQQVATLMMRDLNLMVPKDFIGKYYLLFEGEGLIDLHFDAKIIEKQYQRYLVEFQPSVVRDNGAYLIINSTNPENPIRNLRFVPVIFEKNYENLPFYEDWLKKLEIFRTIRFLAWTKQKEIPREIKKNPDSELIDWEDRTTPNHLNQNFRTGVALEYQIKLCNMLKTNCWFVIPYLASEQYFQEMAKLVRKTLRKDVNIYLEFSNEASWGTFFDAGKYLQKKGIENKLSEDPKKAQSYYYSLKTTKMIDIFKKEFGVESNRLIWVIGGFTLMTSIAENVLLYQDAYKHHDRIVVGVTGYFCGFLGDGYNAAFTATKTVDYILDSCENSLNDTKNKILEHKEFLKNFNEKFSTNIQLAAYEGGSSLVEQNAITNGGETPGLTNLLHSASRHPRMKDIYRKSFNLFEEVEFSEFCHFTFIGRPSKYGYWGLLEHQSQSIEDSPRYMGLRDIIYEKRDVEWEAISNRNLISIFIIIVILILNFFIFY